jgi:hypothetical protein
MEHSVLSTPTLLVPKIHVQNSAIIITVPATIGTILELTAVQEEVIQTARNQDF